MSLSHALLGALADDAVADLAQTDPGLRVRIDHLAVEDAATLCRLIEERVADGFKLKAACLIPNRTRTPRSHQSHEIRNRKQARLLLVVPAGMGSGTASSLERLRGVQPEGAFDRISRSLLDRLGRDERAIVVEGANSSAGRRR